MHPGDITKSIAIGACVVLLGFIFFQGHSLTKETGSTKKEYADLKEKFEQAQLDLQKAKADAAYFALPHNLEKELKSRFNFKGAEEKSIIVVPRSGTSTTSSPPEGNQ